MPSACNRGMSERRTRAWCERTVARWRRSGQTASEFAASQGLQVGALRWWPSRLGRDIRAEHGSAAIVPIEIAVPRGRGEASPSMLEVLIGDAAVRCDVGTDVEYSIPCAGAAQEPIDARIASIGA